MKSSTTLADWTKGSNEPVRKKYPFQWYSYKRWIRDDTPPLFQLQFKYDFNRAAVNPKSNFKFNFGDGWVLLDQVYDYEDILSFRDFDEDKGVFVVGIGGIDHNIFETEKYILESRRSEMPPGIKVCHLFSNQADFLRPFAEKLLVDFPGWSNVDVLLEGSTPTKGSSREASINAYWMTHLMGVLPRPHGREDQPLNSKIFH